ncbi:SGNH/GDSL hydrolase family protein [Caproiciproducens galactitolivorans]|uniref:SGNH/GDSL hydrolase family protein n=1 Tax=Caproiciproducens galactitolivorans TaxID=642589 RepID=A0ABT4BSF2_9FIRM|nr:SGNH/GDSL hydrolase family protein [Caproiciproducens galactitolivorans]MCY1713824.1 SGNH/GDSL hydrolase family protein [Caproiciproducens galactitolivorans]
MRSVLCYGDSNTYGLTPGMTGRYPRDVRWTGVLQKLLGSEWYVIEEGLGGRTTVWDDPIEEFKNGKTYLLPCLDSHKPLDVVVIMLGTNDLKRRFSLPVCDIAYGMENLVKTILKSDAGVGGAAPQVLLVAPVPIQDIGKGDWRMMFGDGIENSFLLAEEYQRAARRNGIFFLNPGQTVEVGREDGMHYTPQGHRRMAEILAEKIHEIYPDG